MLTIIFGFFHVFLNLVLGRSFPALIQFLGFFGGPKGNHFSLALFKKVPFFLKRWDPGFCTPLQRFGLILQGLGPPAGAKKRM